MKKTQKKDAVRNIRKRIVSYLSICLVIMLGVGGVFITRYMAAGITKAGTEYFNDHALKNYELISSLGATDEDIEQIKGTEGVTDAEGVVRNSGSLTKGSLNRSVEIVTMTERISVPEVVEGEAPAAKDECMIGEDLAFLCGLKVGDRVKLVMATVGGTPGESDESFTDEEDEDAGEETAGDADEEGGEEAAEEEAPDSVLLAEEFTITGLMKHPDYFRRKSVDTVAVPLSAINKDVTDGFYSHVFVKAEEPEGVDIFSDKYFEKTAGTKQALEELTETLAVDSSDRAKKKAYARIDEEWEEALIELNDAQEDIEDNEAQLNSELADARKDLADAQKELDSKLGDARKKIRDGEKKIAKAEKKIKNGEKELKDAKKKLKEAEEKLPDAKKYIEENRKMYEEELIRSNELLKMIGELQKLMDTLAKLDPGSEKYKEAVIDVGNYILNNEDKIREAHAFFGRDDVMENAEKIRDNTDLDPVKTITAVRDFNIDSLFDLARGALGQNLDLEAFIADTKEWINTVQNSLNDLDEYEEYVKKFESGYYHKQVKAKEKELNKAKKELAAAKAKLTAAKKTMASEKSKYEAQIRNGWNMYYTQKSEYESKLEEAKALLAENREEAEEKLAEARAEVEKIECKWLVFDRRGNAGFVDIKSSIGAIGDASVIFGVLFMLISAVVCFSTLTIIIEEQKKMVGTVKAFGFFRKEILGKYLVFGVTAAIIGAIAGILLALGLSGAVLNAYNDSGMYQFDAVKSVVTPGVTLGASALMVAICAVATVIACSDILKSPASVLMKGGTAKKNSGGRKTSSRRGSLYSKLIIRNMLDDKARVAISIIIIAFSTLLIGTGISMKLGYDGMTTKQLSDVHKYDIRVDLGDKVTDADMKKIEETMAADGAEYLLASYESHIFQLGDRLDVLNVLTADPDRLGEFFAVKDITSGEDLTLPDDGVLVQKKMKDSYGMGAGAELLVRDSGLGEKKAAVKGEFQNYVGRIAVTSPAGYRSIFEEDPVYNCYYVKAGEAGVDKLESDILAVNGDVSFEASSEFASKFETVSFLYNIIVYVTTGIAIIMSFMILTNLANIFLNRKKTELTVMRINGFSIKQTKGYLSRETIVTTAIGIVLGVLAGAAADPFIIRAMEQPDLQFIRSFHPLAWVAAVVLEVLFSVIINSLVFRKVKDLNFRDIS